MKRHIKPMLAAAILSAAACSPIDNPCKGTDTRQEELSISVSTEELTRAMITDSMLPDVSEMGIALFDSDGNIYMWKSPVCVTPEAQVPLTLESKFKIGRAHV